jgi:hypothetical protein
MAKLFGFEIKRLADLKDDAPASFVPPTDDEGATVVAEGGMFGTYVDLEGTARTEAELVTKYREMALQPEVEEAIGDIVNESIVGADDEIVSLDLDRIDEMSDNLKERIREEFKEILSLLEFSQRGYDIFRRWYVDGRLYFHAIIDEKNVRAGIKELRYIDPRKIKKIKEVKKKRVGKDSQVSVTTVKNEYYIFNEKGFLAKGSYSGSSGTSAPGQRGLKIAKDSILHCVSGLMDQNNQLVLSYLHKAIKPLNQLRTLEDASVIYRISRAPERRIFYIDVGNLPKMKAEQYLRDMMVKHKNRLVYDANSGEVRDDRKHMTMLEDFWLPRREGGRGTEITTLPGGQNLGEMDDVEYFQRKLYKSLNVPVSRLDPETGFSLGRASEISRDELKFSKFIDRIRAKFATQLFNYALEKQLVLKNIMSIEEFDEIKNLINYDFQKDNHFTEMKDAEIYRERIQTLRDMDEYVGRYYSQEWVRKNVLYQSDEDVEDINKQIEAEGGDEDVPQDDER